MKKKLIVLSGFVFVLAPFVALAQVTGGTLVCTGDIKKIGELLCKVAEILGAILPVLVALGMVYFVWGVISYVIASDEEAKSKGRNRIIYGIIGLAVIIGVWGLVTILNNTFGLGNVRNINFPTVPLLP